MTYNQQQQYRKLINKVQKAYKDKQANTDKTKQAALNEAWAKAAEKADKFLMKHP